VHVSALTAVAVDSFTTDVLALVVVVVVVVVVVLLLLLLVALTPVVVLVLLLAMMALAAVQYCTLYEEIAWPLVMFSRNSTAPRRIS
jgi:hypothetical protein